MRNWRSLAIRGGTTLLAILIVLSAPAWTGCSSLQPQCEPAVVAQTEPTPAPPPEPTLNAPADAHLTLFGEMPDQSRIPFQARAASPMKQHSFAAEGADFDVDLSPDGKWLAFSSTRNAPQPDLYLKTVDGQAVTQVTSDPAADVQPAFSPDGKTVAFASNRSGNWDLWLVSLQGGQCTQLTLSPQHEVHPSFAPDGRRLAYCVFNDRAAAWELWVLHLDQPGSRKMIGSGLFPRWSPKGDSIVYQKARQRGGRWFSIWRIDFQNGEPAFPVELAASPSFALIQPTWSPDGAWISYGTARVEGGTDLPGSAPEASRGEIWMMRADGSMQLQLTDGGAAHFSPAWGADGRVYFSSRQSGSECLWSVRPVSADLSEAPMAAGDAAPEPAAVRTAAHP